MSEYKRLTERDKNGFVEFEECEKCDYCGSAGCDSFENAINRLAELEDKIEKGLLVPRYSILQDLEFGWWCVCEVDEQSRIIAQCKTEEEAKRKLEELTNE